MRRVSSSQAKVDVPLLPDPVPSQPKQAQSTYAEAGDPVQQANRAHNKLLATQLLDRNSYVFKDVAEREDPFQNEIFKIILLRLWFNDRKSIGVKYRNLFLPVSTTILAFVACLVKKSLKDHISDSPKTGGNFVPDEYRVEFESFRTQIKRFQAHPEVIEEGIYTSYVTELGRAVGARMRRMEVRSSPSLFDGETASEDDTPAPHSIDDNDILRSVQKRKRAKLAVASNAVGTPVTYKGSNNASTGAALAKSTPDPFQLWENGLTRGNNTASTSHGDLNPTALTLGTVETHESFAYNSTGSWGVNGVQHDPESCTSTIYPEDSFSQQITGNNTVSDVFGSTSNAGFLEQLNAPF